MEEDEQRGGACQGSEPPGGGGREPPGGGGREPPGGGREPLDGGRELDQQNSLSGENDSNWNHTNNDVTSCPIEAVQTAAAARGKTGSDPVVVPGNNRTPASERLEKVRKWSVTTYKVTRQVLSEKMGRGSRTVDLDLEPRLEVLKDDRRRYDHVTKLAQTLANQLSQMTQTQKTLGEAFADLSLKTPPLHVEFGLNAETQRFLSKSGEALAAAINSFTADMNTLINKTIEDTMVNVKQYENARVEYDAYRCDMEELNMGPRDPVTIPKLEQAQRTFQNQREKYQKIRDDLNVKLRLLEENKVKVLHNQLLVLHGAVANYTSACHLHVDQTMSQASARMTDPTLQTPSWLEDS